MNAALIAVVLIGVTLPAWAQLPPIAAAKVPHPAAAAAPKAAPVLTPAQAQGVLEVLQNDAKRTQFIAVLQNMAKVQAATAAKTGALSPGSLGAELLAAASGAMQRGSAALLGTLRTLTNFTLFRAWLTYTLQDPGSRARLVDAGWKLVLLVGLGGAAEWASRRGLSRFRDGINRAAPHEDPANVQPDPHVEMLPPAALAAGPDADVTRSRIAPVKPTAWTLLRRLPYVLLRLLLDVGPFAAFAVVAYGLLATPLARAGETRLIILGVVDAYLAIGVGLALVRALLSPRSTALRLVHMSDASAAYLTRWARRFAIVGIGGYAVDQTGLVFGMFDSVHEALLKVVALVLHGFAAIVVLQCRARVARRLRGSVDAHGAVAMIRRRLAEMWHVLALFFIVASWLVFAFEVRRGYAIMWHGFFVLAVVLVVARLISIMLTGALDRTLRPRAETVLRYPGLDTQARRYLPLLRWLINAGLTVVAVFILLQLGGVSLAPWVRRGTLGGRIAYALSASGLIVLLAIVVWEGANAAIQRHLGRLTHDGQVTRAARLLTLLPMLRTTMMVVIFVFAALMVLSQIGVNTAPLLAGAGVVGIAIGFGSQKLVQDVITGLFLLLENTMQVGDTVSLAGLTGTVEYLSIRTIRLRALDGAVHIVPFSAVTTVTNATRDYGYAVLDVTAGYNEEPDHIADVLRTIAAEMRADPAWHGAIDDDLEVQGVDRFMDNAWVLRARVKTVPAQRLAVQREFNRRLKYRFDKLAIESPFTSPRILSTVPGPPPVEVEVAEAAPA